MIAAAVAVVAVVAVAAVVLGHVVARAGVDRLFIGAYPPS